MKRHPISFALGVAAGIPIGLFGFLALLLWEHIDAAIKKERAYYEKPRLVVVP